VTGTCSKCGYESTLEDFTERVKQCHVDGIYEQLLAERDMSDMLRKALDRCREKLKEGK
jgi:hypothetical protein